MKLVFFSEFQLWPKIFLKLVNLSLWKKLWDFKKSHQLPGAGIKPTTNNLFKSSEFRRYMIYISCQVWIFVCTKNIVIFCSYQKSRWYKNSGLARFAIIICVPFDPGFELGNSGIDTRSIPITTTNTPTDNSSQRVPEIRKMFSLFPMWF